MPSHKCKYREIFMMIDRNYFSSEFAEHMFGKVST